VRETDASACSAWRLRLPSNLKIFAYLADIDRLSTRSNLFYKNCAPPEICVACQAVKTERHLLFECRVAATVWSRLGVVVPTAPCPSGTFPRGHGSPRLAHGGRGDHVVGWHARKDLIFNATTYSAAQVLLQPYEDLLVWRWRFPVADRHLEDIQNLPTLACSLISSCCCMAS
jgi:hypothetical protein